MKQIHKIPENFLNLTFSLNISFNLIIFQTFRKSLKVRKTFLLSRNSVKRLTRKKSLLNDNFYIFFHNTDINIESIEFEGKNTLI